jgi:hypothetical protein
MKCFTILTRRNSQNLKNLNNISFLAIKFETLYVHLYEYINDISEIY